MGKQIAYRQLVRAGRARGFILCRIGDSGRERSRQPENIAVRAEEAVEPEIAAMAIANPELAAELGMGNVRQNKRHRE